MFTKQQRELNERLSAKYRAFMKILDDNGFHNIVINSYTKEIVVLIVYKDSTLEEWLGNKTIPFTYDALYEYMGYPK